MSKKRMSSGSPATDVHSIIGIIAENETAILEKWLIGLKAKVARWKDLFSDEDSRKRCAEFLRSLMVGLRRGDLADVNADEWSPLKQLLKDTFTVSAVSTPSSSNAAYYVFALKDTLSELFQTHLRDQPASFKRQFDRLLHLLDQLGLFAFETVSLSQNRPSHPGTRRHEPAKGASGELDTAQLLHMLVAFKKGDFSARLPVDQVGVAGKIADTLNDIIEVEERMVRAFERVSTAVGREGDFKQRVAIGSLPGSWGSLVNGANTLIDGLIQPTAEIVRVIRAVANGDLSQTITLETAVGPLKGEFLSTARVINTMVEQLTGFAAEVTRVAREVGTEGQLGGQATVEGVSGTWQELTENVRPTT